MSTFIVHPIASTIVDEVRATLRAPSYGHPAHREIARGTGPCRACLRAFDVGVDERLLFTYSPFDGEDSLAQPGPVFVHAHQCELHSGGGYPAGLREISIVAQPHNKDGSIGALCRIVVGDEFAILETLLADRRVAFVHLRHAEAGCFIARVDRHELSE